MDHFCFLFSSLILLLCASAFALRFTFIFFVQMRQIDCAHNAGISATLAVELAEMVSPKAAWVCSPESGDQQRQQQLEGSGSVGYDSGAAATATAAPAARGGLTAVLMDRFPQDPSGRLCRGSRECLNMLVFCVLCWRAGWRVCFLS